MHSRRIISGFQAREDYYAQPRAKRIERDFKQCLAAYEANYRAAGEDASLARIGASRLMVYACEKYPDMRLPLRFAARLRKVRLTIKG